MLLALYTTPTRPPPSLVSCSYPGIALNAVLLTFATAASCMAALRTGLVRVDDGFIATVRTVRGTRVRGVPP